tara:strand:- start:585 stop:1724 length:1140 start_codon:yes stop_codon:yes gene_type:complete
MLFLKKIGILLILFYTSFLCSQTAGFNYQALILNSEEIQIPGTNVSENKFPLSLEAIVLRFTITNQLGIEYAEKHTITTDKSGVVSVIVGQGKAITANFNDIIWDGKLKYLNVELKILKNNNEFIFLDTQKILYIPSPFNYKGITIVETILELPEEKSPGDLAWVKNNDGRNIPMLMIWNGSKMMPVNQDFDATNEFSLLVVADEIARDLQFKTPKIGDEIWNQQCACLEVYDGINWVSIKKQEIVADNGLYLNEDTIQLGGALTRPSVITTTAINSLAFLGLQESTNAADPILVIDKSTGVLKHKYQSSKSQKKIILTVASEGQLEFTTPLSFSQTTDIDVFRNGVRISFTAVNSNTVRLEIEARCYENDQIRIVQLY